MIGHRRPCPSQPLWQCSHILLESHDRVFLVRKRARVSNAMTEFLSLLPWTSPPRSTFLIRSSGSCCKAATGLQCAFCACCFRERLLKALAAQFESRWQMVDVTASQLRTIERKSMCQNTKLLSCLQLAPMCMLDLKSCPLHDQVLYEVLAMLIPSCRCCCRRCHRRIALLALLAFVPAVRPSALRCPIDVAADGDAPRLQRI